MTTLLAVFAEVTKTHGDKLAIIEGNGDAISFTDLEKRSKHLANHFVKRGVVAGDRVLVAMPVGIDLFASLAAIWQIGATVVFPEPAMGLKGLRHAARITKPKAFLSSGWYRLLGWFVPELFCLNVRLSPKVEHQDQQSKPAHQTLPQDIALISFTSGSTGAPKAIARSHAFMMAQANAISPLLRSNHDDERDLVAFPVFVLVCLSLGITAVLPNWKLSRHDRATAETISAQITRQNITRLLVPPIICETLADSSFPKLRAVFTGGGPVFPDTMLALIKTQPDLRFVAVFGSTEAEPIAHLEASEVNEADIEAMANGKGLLAGKPVSAVTLQIIDGEVQVAGSHVNQSYLDARQNAENKVVRDGRIWHRTGDAARLDETGRIWLLGRFGHRVAGIDPFSVETAARFWPGLRRSALVAMNGKPVLAVEGDKAHFATWSHKAAQLGINDVRVVSAIPMDKRHRSKVDLEHLKKQI